MRRGAKAARPSRRGPSRSRTAATAAAVVGFLVVSGLVGAEVTGISNVINAVDCGSVVQAGAAHDAERAACDHLVARLEDVTDPPWLSGRRYPEYQDAWSVVGDPRNRSQVLALGTPASQALVDAYFDDRSGLVAGAPKFVAEHLLVDKLFGAELRLAQIHDYLRQEPQGRALLRQLEALDVHFKIVPDVDAARSTEESVSWALAPGVDYFVGAAGPGGAPS